MNRVTDEPIALEPLLADTADPAAGALVVFGGTVRDHHEGRRVAAIAYSAYRPMAERVLAELEAEVIERFGVGACRIVHRVGELAIGEESVVVVVRAAHRGEAFEAARYAIDTLKVRAPFWKDEHYEDGTRAYQQGVPLTPPDRRGWENDCRGKGMTNLTREAVEQALRQVRDHYLGTDPVSAGCVDEIVIDDESVRVVVQLGYPAGGYRQTLGEELRAAIEQGTGAQQVQISVQTRIHAHAVQPGVKAQDEIKNIIAVASGKGGVGKSTVTANLALALQADGARVGVLDADIYGPSQPRMLGVRGQPESRDGKHMQPMLGHGIQVMSAGFLVDEETPMIWRGPMVTQALEQLLTETAWEGLDYLIVDMPPGTGDIQLTLAQKVPVSGGVIVTTPQDIALLDARKGLRMFEKVDVAVLGIVENMSTHICSNCGHEEHIFGSGGGAAMASQYGVHLLGSLPLDITIREQSDSGHPTVAADPDGRIATDYRHMARSVAAQLSLRERSSGSAFPNIVVGDSSE